MFSKVLIHPSSYIRSPLLLIVKERREKKSSPERQKKRCDRFTLVLIAALLTSLHTSQEVLDKTLLYLSKCDLVAASSTCRAWRPVAQRLLHSRLLLIYRIKESQACGYQLNSLVFGNGSAQIVTLTLDERISPAYRSILALIVSKTLNNLNIDFKRHSKEVCHEAFFSRCQGIRNLRLTRFTFGEGISGLFPTITDGFSRLLVLELKFCHGNVRSFAESTPIPGLEIMRYFSKDAFLMNLVIAMVLNYGPTLIKLNIDCCSISSAILAKIAECCLGLESLSLYWEYDHVISLLDMKIVASLPRLKCLMINDCEIADGAVSALARCVGLKRLGIGCYEGINDVVRVIGKKLVSMVLRDVSVGAIDRIVEYCPILQYLEVDLVSFEDDGEWREVDESIVEESKMMLKSGLKRLAKLEVNGKCVRLGTDWDGKRKDRIME